MYKPTSNTNPLHRHVELHCEKVVNDDNKGIEYQDSIPPSLPKQQKYSKMMVNKSDKERLKQAASKFVAKDLRPYSVIEGIGLLDLCYECFEFGKKYRRATQKDFMETMPSRNTVKAKITEMAGKTREHIGTLMKRAIETGGISATTDTWTDDYKKLTYISVIAHMCVYDNGRLQYHRFTLATTEITEMVKAGKCFTFKSKFEPQSTIFECLNFNYQCLC